MVHRLSEPPNLHNDEAIAESLRITSPSLVAVRQPFIFPVSSAGYATTRPMSHSGFVEFSNVRLTCVHPLLVQVEPPSEL